MVARSRNTCLVGVLVVTAFSRVQSQGLRDQSATNATVVQKDGSTLELHDFAFYTSDRLPVAYYPGDRSTRVQPLAVKTGRFWHIFQIDQLSDLQRAEDQGSRDWIRVNGALTSGDRFTGQLPLSCHNTWLECDGFEFSGEAAVLGSPANFSIDLDQVRTITRLQGIGRRYQVRDTSGAVTSVNNLAFRSHSQPPNYFRHEFAFTRVFEGGRRTENGQPFDVVVDRSKVSIKLEQVESIRFPEKWDGMVHFRMRTGDEADGRFSDEHQVTRGFGRSANGEVWFEDLSGGEPKNWSIRSISFGPLAANQ